MMRKVIYMVYYTAPNGALLSEQFYTFGPAADRALECREAHCTEISVVREYPNKPSRVVVELTSVLP